MGLRHHLSLDTLQQSILDIIKNGVVLNDSQILRLTEKLLVWIDAGPKHLRTLLRAHLTHLLSHLVGSWQIQG